MNTLQGKIESIDVSGDISLVKVAIEEEHISAIVIDTPLTVNYLKVGGPIKVVFKETEVVIGKGTDHMISLQNKIIGKIQSIETEKLLGKLIIDTKIGEISAIITTQAIKQLELKDGTEVTAMIKTNEVMLAE